MKETRLYSIYLKVDGKFQRDPATANLAFKKSTAIRIFQNRMLYYAMSGIAFELRPVK